MHRRLSFFALLTFATFAAACPGAGLTVKPIGTRVDALPPATPPAPPGAEQCFPAKLPGGWTLSGGPATWDGAHAPEALKDEAGRFRGLVSYASAEYSRYGQAVASFEAFQIAATSTAAGDFATGKPNDAKSITGDDVDEAWSAGMKAEARKGALIARVRWYDADDPNLPDAAVEAMRDALENGVKAGLAVAAPLPGASPSPSPSPSPAPSPAP